MSLDKAMKNMKFDKRLTDWNLNNGQLSKDELQKHLEQLPDLTNQVDLLSMEEESSSEAH